MNAYPPPMPAITLPDIIIHSFLASPHISVPAQKKIFENKRPVLLEKMSVSRPDRGCSAAFAIK